MKEPYRVLVSADDQRHAGLVMQMVAVRLNTPIRIPAPGTRLSPTALRARRVSMYLSHIALGWPLERVGHAFGVHRQTASIACRRIEDARDEPNLDTLLDQLEEAIRGLCDAPPPDLPALPDVPEAA
ncbi:chromosomal replication initiator DnaA [Brevundimonas sp. R86498]|uniref:chromosomal replication initiator DnaA n=1 Tax=Brevundimonas sp. R86498 TaxID=3093845 RepID=UPI0037CAE45A